MKPRFRAIRTSRWRYAEWGSSSAAELYVLEKDPAEHTNLAGKSAFKKPQEKLRRLRALRVGQEARDGLPKEKKATGCRAV